MGPTPDEALVKRGYRCQVCDAILSGWWTRRKFCSEKCRSVTRRKKVFTCAVCQQVWEPANRMTQNKRKTCSAKCRSTLLSWVNTGYKRIKTKPPIACPICQSPMSKLHANGSPRTACSKSCATKLSWQSTKRKKRHWNSAITSNAPQCN